MNTVLLILPDSVRPYAKAVVAFVAVLVGAVLLVLDPGQSVGDVTQYEWLVISATVVSTAGLTYAVPNRPQLTPEDDSE